MRSLLTLCVLTAFVLPAYAGNVTGIVRYEGKVPKMRPIDMSSDPACCLNEDDRARVNEALVLGADKTMANVLVEVVNVPKGDYPAPEAAVVLTQKGCRYSPHVLAVRAGQPIKILNPDGTVHNVNGMPEKNDAFNVGMPKDLAEYTLTLDTPEPPFPIRCDVHPWMRSYCVVFDHPFFAVTDDSGVFEIEGLPPGEYTIRAWHEKLGEQTASVTVTEQRAGVHDFTFARPSAG